MAHPRPTETPTTNSEVVGATNCPLYKETAFKMLKIAIKVVLVRRYPVTLISGGGLANGEASARISGCKECPGRWAIGYLKRSFCGERKLELLLQHRATFRESPALKGYCYDWHQQSPSYVSAAQIIAIKAIRGYSSITPQVIVGEG
jgi:hypothetical protein